MIVETIKKAQPLGSRILSHSRTYEGNPQGPIFDRAFRTIDNEREIARMDNRVGQGNLSLTQGQYGETGNITGNFGASNGAYMGMISSKAIMDSIADNQVQLYWRKNRDRRQKYWQVAQRAEVKECLANIVNEAIDFDSWGKTVSLDIDPDAKFYKGIVAAELHTIFRQEVLSRILEFDREGYNLMWRFLVEGRFFMEVIYDEKSNAIVGINHLPSQNMIVVVQDGAVIGYRQMLENDYSSSKLTGGRNYIDYSPHQILYGDLGTHMYGPGGINDIRSIIEPAIRPHNILNTIEDAVVMYRILWGSERLVFKIDVGAMPAQKAEKYMKDQAKLFSRRMEYDSSTGTIANPSRVLGLAEHFFMPLSQQAKGSSIDRLKGGEQLGNIDDLKFFKKALVTALNVPIGRVTALMPDGGEKYSSGKVGEVTQSEVAFARLVSTYSKPLGNAIINLFIMVLNTKPKYSNDVKDCKWYKAKFSKTNSFREWIDTEVLSKRLETYKNMREMVMDKANPSGTLTQEYAYRKGLHLSNEDIVEITQGLKQEKARLELDGMGTEPLTETGGEGG